MNLKEAREVLAAYDLWRAEPVPGPETGAERNLSKALRAALAECDRLTAALREEREGMAELVRSARFLGDVNSPEGLKWMLDARAALDRYEESKG